MNRIREILERLSIMGDEAWKTPGHPMNSWVSKDSVQSLAREALKILKEEGH